ncbi:MAG: hypothetical protein COS72_01280 [Candidatus Moranbacteria bacterium CG06_land_8_20_14_3_00_43_56]|nr:MAG: hypothetical protein COS72_01280 [Candidatus Moranbacteria bacterium CG06_land_8_20_14_3_00_43_56]PIV84127.1 MAG: hypothetical protein COW51_01515 [Candidatus Moranbacteria bacterium CG17_big_fil_post_rev_8_21_14_2_50_44_12]PIW92926.1 MAG: hypothetical protein COZ87_04110 [Candidatus Moranbacteria bacterium CG_4_8_14_3_um_filter_43_15]PJA85482.1 MAG: hypothetical protein CO142_03840 [Candidatus Moranbacteria bacterium CG_4_9_14_3_um_filter_44_28]
MRKIEYNPKDLLYPEDPQELVQRVFSLRKLICQYLNKNDPNYESKKNAIELIARETMELRRNQNAETIMIKDWKTGLDLLRNEIRELREQRKKSKK